MKNMNTVENILEKAYNGSYYTIIGAGGDLNEWKDGYQELLDKEDIGKISEWVLFKGKDVNDYYKLEGDNRFRDSLNFLAFPLDGLNISKLAIFKIKMRDRWFDDIIDNSRPNMETE